MTPALLKPRPRTPKANPSSNGTVKSMGRQGRRYGRWLLWTMLFLLVVVVGGRGVKAIVAPTPPVRAVASTSVIATPEVQAFAARFASAYLTYDPARPDDQAKTLTPMLSDRVSSDVAVRVPTSGRAQRVTQTWVARVQRLGRDRALVTVACLVTGAVKTTRYLAVPVAWTDSAVVVDDFPALTSPPRRATVPAAAEQALEGPDADAIEALLTRFLPEYLHGGIVAPEFLVPGVHLARLGHAYALEDLTSLAETGPATPAGRRVLAIVSARDVDTGAIYTLRYRITVAQSDRWLVQHVEG